MIGALFTLGMLLRLQEEYPLLKKEFGFWFTLLTVAAWPLYLGTLVAGYQIEKEKRSNGFKNPTEPHSTRP